MHIAPLKSITPITASSITIPLSSNKYNALQSPTAPSTKYDTKDNKPKIRAIGWKDNGLLDFLVTFAFGSLPKVNINWLTTTIAINNMMSSPQILSLTEKDKFFKSTSKTPAPAKPPKLQPP